MQKILKKIRFSVQIGMHNITGDHTETKEKPDLFMLHGAGKSTRQRFDFMREKLLRKGLASLSFDLPGHGETGGDLSSSSLRERTEIANKIISSYSNGEAISIVGNSMSGYTAVKLTEIYEVENLILIVPAAYDKAAYELHFNETFSKCLRREKSYLDSDSWKILKNYKGNLLIISAESDEVIPREIIERLMSSSVNAKSRKLITVKNAPHGIMSFMRENPKVMDEVVVAIEGMLKAPAKAEAKNLSVNLSVI
jgi:hypothetical protein